MHRSDHPVRRCVRYLGFGRTATCPVVSVGTALGADRRAIHDACPRRPEERTALRAHEESRQLTLSPSRIPMPPAALRRAVLASPAFERHTASLTLPEHPGSPPLSNITPPAQIRAKLDPISLRPEINPTELTRSRLWRHHSRRCLEHRTWHAG